MGNAAENIEHDTRRIPVEVLVRFPRDPRGPIDVADPEYIELRESMRARGQIMSVVVRPDPGDGDQYQVLIGNRRTAAARELGIEELTCTVREDLEDDDAAYEVALVENLQRKNLSPLEEADSYGVLLARRGATVVSVASQVGKSERYVADRLRLRQLVPAIREMVAGGAIDLGGALTLASTSLLSQGRMVKRLKVIVEQQPRISRRDIDGMLQGETKSLRGVEWKLDDAELVPEAGPCTTCPKRTGVQGSLIDELVEAEDVCLDDQCFGTKAKKSFEATAAAARAAGAKVLSAAESERVLQHGRPKYDSAYMAADDTTHIGNAYKKVADIVTPDAQVVIGQDQRTGAAVKMYLKKDVQKIAAAKNKGGNKKSAPAASSSSSKPKKVDPKREAAEAKERERHAVEQLVPVILLRELRVRIASGKTKASVVLLALVENKIRDTDLDAGAALAVSLDVGSIGSSKADEDLSKLARRCAKKPEQAAVGALVELLVELEVADRALPLGGPPIDKKLAAAIGIDVERARKLAVEQLAAKKLEPKRLEPKKGAKR